MEDLYENLENYNEERTIAGLSNENKELKFKLEEYASTLNKLQKDFDKLTSEYKKLELNYSSLLKTAKAEIERKTQIITNLNIEKDTMMLKILQKQNYRSNTRMPHEKAQFTQTSTDVPRRSMSNDKSLHTQQQRKDMNPSQNVPHEKAHITQNTEEDLNRRSKSNDRFLNAQNKIESGRGTSNDSPLHAQHKKGDDANRRSMTNDRPPHIQNKEDVNSRSVSNDRQHTQYSKEESKPQFEKTKDTESTGKQLPRTINERKEDHFPKSEDPKDRRTSANTGAASRLLNLAMGRVRPKHSDSKEDITRIKGDNDTYKARASIRNRRKSMPAVCLENEDFSTDDDDSPNTGSSKDQFSRDSRGRRRLDPDYGNKRRTPEVPFLEDRHSGATRRQTSQDSQRSRYDRNDHDKYRQRDKSAHRFRRQDSPDDKYRQRDKSAHRFRRQDSPERFRRGVREDHYRRIENEKRRVETPQTDRFHNTRKSREPQRNNYERSQPPDYEENRHRSQEKYPMKHKISHDYDEPNSKRLKPDAYHIQYEEEQRLQNERDFLEKKFISEPLEHTQFISCESPDYSHHDVVPTHQTREIKLTAATKLDDPRISNKKYILKQDSGKVTLTTVEGRNVDMKLLCKSIWEVKEVSMPEALVRRPSLDNKEIVKEIYVDTDNPVANISMETGEIADLDKDGSQNCPEIVTEQNVTQNRIGQNINPKDIDESKNSNSKHISKHIDESKSDVNSPQMDSNYKIPKLKNNDQAAQSHNIEKTGTLSLKPKCDNSPKGSEDSKSNISDPRGPESFQVNVDTINKHKPSIQEEKKQDNFLNQKNKYLPFLGSSDLYETQRYFTAKEVVEGDLELSDDTCDNSEPQKDVTKVSEQNLKIEDDKRDTKHIVIIPTTTQSDPTPHDVDKERLSISKEKCKEKGPDNRKKHTATVQEKCKEESPDNSKKHTATVHTYIKSDQKPYERTNIAEEKCKEKIPDNGKKSKRNKRKSKHKEIKEECGSKDQQKVKEKPPKIKEKVTKTKEIKTKYTELFGDSSSLISPEDLGLVPTSAPTVLPEMCVPFFEDAQDAVDLNTINPPLTEKPNTVSIPEIPQVTSIENKTKVDTENYKDRQELPLLIEHNKQPTPNEEIPIQILYQNLQVGNIEKENDLVQTIIISTGVQPQCSVNVTDLPSAKMEQKIEPMIQEEQPIKPLHDVNLKALATSTPHKAWQPNAIQAEIEAKPDTSCNSSDSRMANVENNTMDTNTLGSQTNVDVPDVRIFVRRRRKVFKKS